MIINVKAPYLACVAFFDFGSLWSRGWVNDPTSVLPIGMPLSPITEAMVVIFSELGFAASASGTAFWFVFFFGCFCFNLKRNVTREIR